MQLGSEGLELGVVSQRGDEGLPVVEDAVGWQEVRQGLHQLVRLRVTGVNAAVTVFLY